MPANKKHLTKSPLHRFLKIISGLVGGYAITEALFIALLPYWNPASTLITLRFGSFIVWATLLICAFIPKNGWKVWGIYLGILGLLLVLIYVNQNI